MSEGNESVWALYSNFRVKGSVNLYALVIGGYSSSSTAPDSLAYHNGSSWSTSDQDNDFSAYTSCAS